jgi:hypothetical protein
LINFQENDSVLAPAFTPVPVTQPIIVPTTSANTSSSRSRTRPSANDTYRTELIAALNIPESLIERPPGTLDVRDAWGKYKGYQAAQALLHRMRNDGTWTLRKPSSDEMVELFISKSSWHENFTKLLPVAKRYPLLVAWLEQAEDAPEDDDVWGVQKGCYSFGDLEGLLSKLKDRREKKSKRKAEGSVEGSNRRKSKSKKSSGSF